MLSLIVQRCSRGRYASRRIFEDMLEEEFKADIDGEASTVS